MKRLEGGWKTCAGSMEFRGECCCKCVSLAKIRYCSCGKCDGSIKTKLKFACLIPQSMDRGGIYLRKTQHGLCEMFQPVDESK